MLAVVWGQNFALEHSGPRMRESALVAAVSLRDGGVLAKLGAPRSYEGTTTPIVGNLVRIARNPANGDVWLAWLMEPYFERYDASGRKVRRRTTSRRRRRSTFWRRTAPCAAGFGSP